ncbi:perforin-1-like [Tiliqua scincoides]|uniref:perforin-1-like n=1 Tax=Tiliqua scincoides TaxID=71010 RepID=UPI00346374F4
MKNKDPTSAACVFLLFLLLPPVSSKCQKGTADECKKAEFVPGGDFAGKGFDINTLVSRRYVYEEITKDGECTLCENPLLEGKPLQKLPLIITDWKANISCQEKVQHSVHQSPISVAEALTELLVKNDWRNELDVKISPRDKFQWALAGSRSEITHECVKKSSKDKYIFLLRNFICSYYKFRVNKQVNTHFADHIKLLPENYDPSSKVEYFELIRSYGTHVETELDLGVHVSLVTPIPVCVAVLEGLSITQASLCLAVDVGIYVGLDGVTKSSDFQLCKEKKKKHKNFFFRLSSVAISGGWIPSTSPKEWLESAKSRPSLLSFSLEPLHTVVNKTDPRREGLRQAVSEYVRENTLWRNCTRFCPAGSWLSTSEFCSCECPNNNFTNSMCCAPKRGLAKLTVTIERAEGLWGDRITRSDGYVSVSFKRRRMCTHTVWNNNNPTWNITLDFGVIQLDKDFNKLEVEVWDQDFGRYDNLLGRCKLAVEPGTHKSKICYLNHGQMYFRYRLFCGHNLEFRRKPKKTSLPPAVPCDPAKGFPEKWDQSPGFSLLHAWCMVQRHQSSKSCQARGGPEGLACRKRCSCLQPPAQSTTASWSPGPSARGTQGEKLCAALCWQAVATCPAGVTGSLARRHLGSCWRSALPAEPGALPCSPLQGAPAPGRLAGARRRAALQGSRSPLRGETVKHHRESAEPAWLRLPSQQRRRKGGAVRGGNFLRLPPSHPEPGGCAQDAAPAGRGAPPA